MECKRIPSARVSCEALNEIISNPCVYGTGEFGIERIDTKSIEYVESILKSARERWDPAARPALKKWASQVCDPEVYMMFRCVALWGNKKTYFFGQGYRHYFGKQPKKNICLYFGAGRIWAGLLVALWYSSNIKRYPGIDAFGRLPKWRLWDEVEYQKYWPGIKRKKEQQYLEPGGGIRYWPTEGGIKIIELDKQYEYKLMDRMVRTLNDAYTW